MEFAEEIDLKGRAYQLVKIQRGGVSAIYKGDLGFLRIGSKEKISKDLSSHKKMQEYGFPVAKIVEEGIDKDLYYFIEESFGDKCFGLLFREEFKRDGVISDKTFDKFISICVQFTEAQFKSIIKEEKWEEFGVGVHLDLVSEELPDEKEKILKRWESMKANLKVFPFVVSHGDFTPFNIFPDGIIDLENSFYAPIGFDVGAIIEHLNWFPLSHDYEIHRLYKFTDKQREKFCDAIDAIYIKNNLPGISGFLSDFNFAKGLWFVSKMWRTPKIQQFRFDVLREIIS